MFLTVSSFQSMSRIGLTRNDVLPPAVLEPLPDSPTPARKSPPELNPFPLDSSFFCRKTFKWEANDFLVTCCCDSESTVEMKVNLFHFVKENPDKFLQQKIDVELRVYLPCHLIPTEKKENPRGGKDICEPSDLPCYLNKRRAPLRDVR